MAHLVDPRTIDTYGLDELGRRGPKYGVSLPESSAAVILSRWSEELETYKLSTFGYNNRVYFATARSGSSFVIKVCGRYWKRLKTETEVVGFFLVGRLASIPLPKVLAWDSIGKEFGVEYTVMEKVEGTHLKDVWIELSFENKRRLIHQIAELVVSYKSESEGLSVSSPQGKIGNFVIRGADGSKSIANGQLLGVEFDVGATLEGLGPWSSYKAYLRTQLDVKMESVRTAEAMESMRPMLPRVEKLLENLDTNEQIADSHPVVFTHGDLNLQNLLVTWIDDVPTINAVLDWEWSGMFPAEEEFFASFDFLEDADESKESSELRDYFFTILEGSGLGTPRTLPYYEQRKVLYDLRENLFPWYITDCDDVGDGVAKAVREVHLLLTKLNV